MVVWMDGIVFKDRESGKIINKTVYLCVGLNNREYKEIYISVNREQAEHILDGFEQKWGSKYRHAVQSWRKNWDELTAFFDFPVEIRTIIYTTNLIENLNGKIRKYTKTKLSLPSDDALRKSVWLAIGEIEKEWTMPIRNWGIVMNQFIAIFENGIEA